MSAAQQQHRSAPAADQLRQPALSSALSPALHLCAVLQGSTAWPSELSAAADRQCEGREEEGQRAVGL